jgi:hypothetical protein
MIYAKLIPATGPAILPADSVAPVIVLVRPVPLENRICLLACGFVVASGGSAVFVDQPVQYGFSADSLDIEVDCCDAGSLALIAGNPLGDALMRPGRVVVDLVLDQDGAQMRLTKDQHAVEELSRRRVPRRRSQVAFIRGAWTAVCRILGAVCLEDGVEGPGEV